MPRFRLHQSLLALALLTFAGTGYSATPDRSAPGGTAGDIIQPGVSRDDSGKRLRQLAPDLLQNPGARVMRLQQVRASILPRVKRVDEDRYRAVVRPSLQRQLERLGFDQQDVTYFLTDLDRARGAR